MMNITKKFTNIKPMYLLMGLIMIAVAVIIPLQRKNVDKFADAATETYLMGDVDLSGQIEPSDARTVLRVSVKLEELEGVKDCAVLPNSKSEPTKGQLADIDGDGQITPADARAVLRMSVMLEEQKTIEVTIEEPSTEPTSGNVEPTTNKNGLTKAQQEELDALLANVPSDKRNTVDSLINGMLNQGMSFDDVKSAVEKAVKQTSTEPSGADSTTAKQGLTEKEKEELINYGMSLFGYQYRSDGRKVLEYRIDNWATQGKSFDEIKSLVYQSAKDEEPLPEETVPSTYYHGDHNEICEWCGKEESYDPVTGERSCYHSSFIHDVTCPGCGQFVKANTCHDCKALYEYFGAATFFPTGNGDNDTVKTDSQKGTGKPAHN